MHLPLFLFILFAAQTACAQAVIFTTPEYPVDEPEPGVLVQILENVHTLEQSLFPALSESPAKAEQQARMRMKQPDWQEQEARLSRAYQALTDAHALGIQKVPAVVFNDKYVIYGTTDAWLAQQMVDTWRELQP